ncbi:MAG: AraC family transcriptional regulator [Bacteroidales bacterium]|nr:AraC family transcriptional regulator [Bacteroidales bacterium]
MKVSISLFLLILFFKTFSNGQERTDSLLNELNQSKFKSAIYNLLAEATLEDSLEISMQYAEKALQHAKSENNTREIGIAWFGIAEVFSYRYELDSAIRYYEKALQKLKQTTDDYYISYTLNNLGWIYNAFGNYPSAIEKYKESLDYIDKDRYPDDLAHVYINLGNSYHFLGSYFTAIDYFHKSEEILTHLADQSSLPIAYNGLGLAYKYLSKFDSAIYYYNITLELDKKTGNLLDQAVDYGNLGALYHEWKQFDQAFYFHKLAMQIFTEQGNSNDLSIAYNNIGEDYKALGQYDSSLYYLNKALEIDRRSGIEQNIASRYNNIGDVYFELKEHQKALDHYEKSLVINRRTGAHYNIAHNLNNMALVYQKTSNPVKAETLFKESLTIAQEINARNLVKVILKNMVDLYTGRGQFHTALDYQMEIDRLNDSIFKENSRQLLADFHTRFELDQKEKQIELLNTENEFHTKEARQYRKYTIVFAIALFLISGLLVILFIQYNLRKKAYKKLVQKNQQLASKFHLRIENAYDKNLNMIPAHLKTGNGNYRELFEKVNEYLEAEKPFLQPDLTMKDMAEKLQTNTHYLSEVINQKFGNNFAGLINEYRVKEACQMLAGEEYENYTIESIANQAGFNSKSAFNNAFKAVTGLTPSYYRKTVNRNI